MHEQEDVTSSLMCTSQLILLGSAKQGQLRKAFGVSLTTIKRYTKLYREGGAPDFFKPKKRV